VTIWVPIVLILVLALVLKHSVWGRRFEVVGAGPAAAHAMGLPVKRYEMVAYVGAAVCYSLAGILLAGFLARPGVFQGDPYLLSTIAAVAIGGTALGGGRGSVLATAVGALFLTQLGQVALASGTPSSVQYLIQGAVIIVGIGLRGHSGLRSLRRLLAVPRRSSADPV
jgi:ribose transport system permease protein